jgi:hypothetical protein
MWRQTTWFGRVCGSTKPGTIIAKFFLRIESIAKFTIDLMEQHLEGIMLLKFYCANKDCSYKEVKPYLLNIPSVDLHEKKVMEEIFCPLCKRKLIRQIRVGEFDGFILKYD